jgi:hypothetical protein
MNTVINQDAYHSYLLHDEKHPHSRVTNFCCITVADLGGNRTILKFVFQLISAEKV